MKTFKQYLNFLEKLRKKEEPKVNSFPDYVHGRHSREEPKVNSFPDYVHGRHSRKETNNESYLKSSSLTENIKKEWNFKHDDQHIKDLDTELDAYYLPHLNENPDHKEHVYRYTKASRGLNTYLLEKDKAIKNGTPLPETAIHHQERMKHLDEILGSHPAPKDFMTYTGVSYNPKKLLNENNDLDAPAYISSSISPDMARGFATSLEYNERHILKIPVRKGSTLGAYVDGVSHYGKSLENAERTEMEFIHKRGQKYRLDPTPKIYKDSWGGDIHVWTATPHDYLDKK
jgi:hypothetical protein